MSSSLIGRPIHSALCHIEAKRFVNYNSNKLGIRTGWLKLSLKTWSQRVVSSGSTCFAGLFADLEGDPLGKYRRGQVFLHLPRMSPDSYMISTKKIVLCHILDWWEVGYIQYNTSSPGNRQRETVLIFFFNPVLLWSYFIPGKFCRISWCVQSFNEAKTQSSGNKKC